MSISEVKLKKFPAQRGRISTRQQYIFNSELGNYCLTISQFASKERENIFGRSSNLILDIGFGNGDQLSQLSEELPLYNFVGIELYKKGIANLIRQIQHKNLTNIKIIYGEAKTALQECFLDHSIYKIQIFFPDPWPKRRHHKRRLIQPDFINIVKNKLSINGVIHIATDSNDYAEHIIKVMSGLPEFDQLKNIAANITRPTTKFEKIGRSLGHKIWDLIFVLRS